jgi:hypothetical protein
MTSTASFSCYVGGSSGPATENGIPAKMESCINGDKANVQNATAVIIGNIFSFKSPAYGFY